MFARLGNIGSKHQPPALLDLILHLDGNLLDMVVVELVFGHDDIELVEVARLAQPLGRVEGDIAVASAAQRGRALAGS